MIKKRCTGNMILFQLSSNCMLQMAAVHDDKFDHSFYLTRNLFHFCENTEQFIQFLKAKCSSKRESKKKTFHVAMLKPKNIASQYQCWCALIFFFFSCHHQITWTELICLFFLILYAVTLIRNISLVLFCIFCCCWFRSIEHT